MNRTGANWYPYPDDPQKRYRWWDGTRWRGWAEPGWEPPPPPPDLIWNGGPRWEYRVISSTFGNTLEGELNRWGLAGWEVVSIAGMNGVFSVTGNMISALLKRPLSPEALATGMATQRPPGSPVP